MTWPKDSLVLGWSGQKTPWCQGWVSTKESFVQITSTPRSLLPRSPLKTLKAIFRKSKKHLGVFCPNHYRIIAFYLSYKLLLNTFVTRPLLFFGRCKWRTSLRESAFRLRESTNFYGSSAISWPIVVSCNPTAQYSSPLFIMHHHCQKD